MWAKSASRLCECCAPSRTPAPPTIRITSGIVGAPPIMNRSFAAWFTIWSKATAAKSENCSSTTGRRPVRAAPIAQPTNPLSVSGVSRIRSAPKRSYSPSVARKSAADPADVLADHDHVRVGGELELERLADRGDEGERPLARRGRRGVAAMRGEDGRDEVVDARVLVRERGCHGGLDLRLDVAPDRGDGARRRGRRSRGAPRAAAAGPGAPTPRRAPGRGRRAGSRASSAACGGTSSSRAATAPRRRGRGRAPPRRHPRPRRGRCRRRPRRASRSPRPGRRCPRPRAACASRRRARTGCSRR